MGGGCPAELALCPASRRQSVGACSHRGAWEPEYFHDLAIRNIECTQSLALCPCRGPLFDVSFH
jgi:hypothetical protein